METGTENRGRDLPTCDERNVLGMLRVEMQRWEVQGPHHLHEFRYIQEATTVHTFILRNEFVEHWFGGTLVERFGWGHGVTDAYTSSQTWREQTGGWYVDLISRHVFEHDLPCCGGRFVQTKEIT